jgi:hypothetical protein
MATSEAKIRANQQNARLSTGPKTTEGKEISRQNALKHGLTGDGIVIPAEDADEVERRFIAFRNELQPSGEVGLTLIRRAALLAVRMEKCAERDLAAIEERVVEAMADVEISEGTDPAELSKLQAEAGRLAAFDTSKAANLARRYEAAAERGFFRALREFRLVEKQAKKVDPANQLEQFRNELGSFLEMKKLDDEFDAEYPELELSGFDKPFDPAWLSEKAGSKSRIDVPMTIGRSR